MGQTDPKYVVLSAVVQLDEKRRFRVPRAILEALHWETPNGPDLLIAELVDAGRLRLWEKALVSSRLNAMEKDLLADAGDEDDAFLAENLEAYRAFQDRYRELTLRPSDGRVQLPAILHSILEPNQLPTPLYVELGWKCLEVLSPQARIERLRIFRPDTNLE